MKSYKFTLILVGLLFFNSAMAASPVINKPTLPYEILTISSRIETKQIYLGNLEGDPHTFEFSIGTKMSLVADLSQSLEQEIPLSMIVVKLNDNNKGVTEMGRLTGSANSWQSYSDSVLGLTLSKAEPFNLELTPGIYRLEVSSAVNLGKYMLVVGVDSSADGYFQSLSNIRQVQSFFGYSFFRIFVSSYVYKPIGIIFVLGLLFYTWRNRSRVSNFKIHD